MTCAECRDLLLDLAYGDLPPERSAEVARHLADCAGCSEELAAIERARRLVAPLRSLEEPSAGFDERILAAARAEATMQADGTPGPVIDVSASVKPLGLQPERVDARARVNVVRHPPRARWMRRVAVAGSVAAAAGLAVIVGVSLRRPPLEATEPVPELKVRAPVVSSAVDEARDKAAASAGSKSAATSPGSGGDVPIAAPAQVTPAPGAPPLLVPAPPPPAKRKVAAKEEREVPASAAKQRPEADARAEPQRPAVASGAAPVAQPWSGEQRVSAPLLADESAAVSRPADAPPAPKNGGDAAAEKAGGALAKLGNAETPTAPPGGSVDSSRQQVGRADALRESPATAQPVARPKVEGQVAGSATKAKDVRAPQAAGSAATVAGPVDAEGLERSAETSRRAGRYQAAAQLYREAAGARRSAGDDGRAAWNLAHAVECLAAASLLEEASRARGELLRDYPGQDGPRRAADRALNYPAPPPESGGR